MTEIAERTGGKDRKRAGERCGAGGSEIRGASSRTSRTCCASRRRCRDLVFRFDVAVSRWSVDTQHVVVETLWRIVAAELGGARRIVQISVACMRCISVTCSTRSTLSVLLLILEKSICDLHVAIPLLSRIGRVVEISIGVFWRTN